MALAFKSWLLDSVDGMIAGRLGSEGEALFHASLRNA